jgi:hypothetical protein
MFTRLSNSLHDMATTSWDTVNISKMDPKIVVGLQQLQVRRQNPPDGSALPRANRARDKVTQGMTSNWHFWGPIEGTRCPQPLYLSLGREVSFMPLRVGWHLAVWVFPPGITRESCVKPPSKDFSGEGGISLCLVIWRGTCPC